MHILRIFLKIITVSFSEIEYSSANSWILLVILLIATNTNQGLSFDFGISENASWLLAGVYTWVRPEGYLLKLDWGWTIKDKKWTDFTIIVEKW